MGKPLEGRRILIVEDEYMIAVDMQEWLSDAGAVVIGPVPRVEQAIDLIAEIGNLCAAVLDINLGGGETSYPIVDRLNELRVPYLLATGDVRLLDRPEVGNSPRLEKPIREKELIGAIARLTEGTRQA